MGGSVQKTAMGAGNLAVAAPTMPLAAAGALQQGGGYLNNKMGSKGPLSGLIGQAGGAAGSGFAAPQGANIQQGTTVGNVQGAQAGAANALSGQQGLLAALQGQNGLGQQNAVAQQQNALNAQLNAANGVGTQNSAIQGLQGAAGQYQNIANGTGPNPAQAMLNQQTGQNVANQAALMAGQRGAGSNVGLMARQAAQQGAATQQQAVGQGTTMEAQQRIAGLQGLTGAEQAIGGLGTSQLGAQQAQQQALANQANLIAGQQIAGTTANTQANLANQQQMQNALAGINTANVSSQGNVNAGNAGLAQTQMKGQQDILGGVMGGAGAALGMADGGEVPLVQPVTEQEFMQAGPRAPGPTSSFGQFLSGWQEPSEPESAPPAPDTSYKANASDDKLKQGSSGLSSALATAAMAAKGGLVNAKVSEKEAIIPPEITRGPHPVKDSAKFIANGGGKVEAENPGQKAVKKGNSYANDKIPKKIPEGAVVIPRDIMLGKNPVKGSAEFVRKVLEKRKSK